MKYIDRAFYCLAWFGITAGILLILTVFFWLNYPYKPLTVKSPVKITTKEVRAGTEVFYSVDYCKTMDLPATLTKEYIDGIVYAAPPVVVNNPKGCGVLIGMTLVPNLPGGHYKIRFTYVYKVNPLREVSVVVESDTLVVLEEK